MATPVFDPSKPYEVESGDVPQFDPSSPFELESGSPEQLPEDLRPRLAVRAARSHASPLPSRPPPPPSQPFDYRAVLDRLLIGASQGAQEVKRWIGSQLDSPLPRMMIPGSMRRSAARVSEVGMIPKPTLEQAGREMATEARAESANLAELGKELGGGTAGDIAQMLASTAVASAPVIPAAMLGGPIAAAVVAGSQSFSLILDDATQAYVKQGDPLELAKQKALIPASIGGIITGTLTRVIPGGTEFLARRIATGELTKQAGAGIVKQILINAGLEVPEETLDQASQGIVAKLTYDPNKTGEQIWKEAVIAGLAGGFLSATTGGTMVGIGKIAQSADQAYRRFIERNANAPAPRQEERQQKRVGISPQLQTDRQDRVQPPIVSESGAAPGGGDLPPQVQRAPKPQVEIAPPIVAPPKWSGLRVAARTPDGRIIAGRPEDIHATLGAPDNSDWGFVDQAGRYLTREQAAQVVTDPQEAAELALNIKPAPIIAPSEEVTPNEKNETKVEEEKRVLPGVVPAPEAVLPVPQPPPVRVKPTFSIKPRKDGVPDIWDAIQELGGVASPKQSDFADKGEYDRYKEVFGKGIGRLVVRAKGGNRLDELVQMLTRPDNGIGQTFRLESTSDLYDLAERQAASRAKLREKGDIEDIATQFTQAALMNQGKTPRQQGTQTVQLEGLKIGDTFKIKGVDFIVISISPDDGSITVNDGRRFGRQELPAEGQLYPDKGTFKDVNEQPVENQALTDILTQIESQSEQYVRATLGGFSPADQDQARTTIADQATKEARRYLARKGNLEGFSVNAVIRSRAANWIRDTKKQVRPESLESPAGEDQTLGDIVAQQPAGPPVDQQSVVQGFRATLTPEEQVVFDAGIDAPTSAPMAPFLPRFKAYLDERGIGPKDVFGSLHPQPTITREMVQSAKAATDTASTGQPFSAVLFHGTKAQFRAFDPHFLGANTGASSAFKGFFFASNPRTASSYADAVNLNPDGLAEYKTRIAQIPSNLSPRDYESEKSKIWWSLLGQPKYNDQGFVAARRVTLKNPKVVEAGGEAVSSELFDINDEIDTAKSEGHDGLIVQETTDTGGVSFGNYPTAVIVAFSPEAIAQQIYGQLEQARTQIPATPPSISVGIPQLRALINSPEANLDPVIVSIINAMLDTPALQNLDWSKLAFQLGGTPVQYGGAGGAADVTGWLIQMSRMPIAPTFSHEIFHFLYELLPQAERAVIDQGRREALLEKYPNAPQAVIDGNLSSFDFVEAKLPQIYYRYINGSEFLAHVASEDFARTHYQKGKDTTWQAIRRKIKEWLQALVDAINRARGLPADVQQIARELIQGNYLNRPKNGVLAEQGIRASLAQSLEQFPNIQAEDPARAERAVKIGQAGEAVGQLPVVRDAIADLEARASAEASNSRERFERDVARRVLSNAAIRKTMATPVANVLAAADAVGTAVQNLADLKADPNSTPEELSAATGQAFDAIHTFLQTKAGFDAKYTTSRKALTDELADTYEREVELLDSRDVVTELFHDFVELGRLSLQTATDEEAKKAYNFAISHNSALRKMLKWVADNVDLSGLRNGGITDVAGVINLFTNVARPQFTPDRNRLEQIIGASEEDIRAMARILLRSQPLQARIESAKNLVAGKQYSGVINETKTELAQSIRKGNYASALQLYTRGIVKAGIEQKEARDAVNFYLDKSRRLTVQLAALDEVNTILDRVRQDPEFRRQETEVVQSLNARDVLFSNNGTSIRFKQVNEALPDVEVDLANTVRSWETNQRRLHDLHQQYSDYIQNPTAPNYNAQRANGMRSAMPIIEALTSRLNDPRNSRLLPGMLTKARTKLAQAFRLFGVTTIPGFAFRYGAGPAFAYLKAASQSYSTVGEIARVQLEKHQLSRGLILARAAKAHKLDPETYREMIWVPLASTRQNFSDPVVLKKGDAVGNGHRVLQEDLDYLAAWQAFERDLIDVFNNTGKERFRTIGLLPQGIIFDDKGALRLPFHHGPSTTSRFWPQKTEEWLAKWKNATPEERVTILNTNLSRFVLGYIRGIRQADWKFTYNFPTETYEVLQDMRNNPIESFDDFAERIFDLRTANPDVPAMTLDQVRDDLMADFNRIFEQIERITQKPEGEIKAAMADVDVVGGLSAFNTPRSRIFMPPGWYDYGGVTEAEGVIAAKKSELPFALAYLHSLETTQAALQRIVNDFGQRIKNMPQAKTEATTLMRRGELYYDQAEAIRMLNNVNAELANHHNYLKAPSTVMLADRPHETRYRGGFGLVIASLLASPKAMTTNLIGASMQSVLVRLEVERRGVLNALLSEAKSRIPGAISEIGFQLARNKPAQAILRNAKNRAIIGKMAESIIDWVQGVQALQQRQRDLGLNLNYPLDVQMQSMRETAAMGGRVTEAPPTELRGRIINRVNSFLRRQTKRISTPTLNFMDSRANGWGLQFAEESEGIWKQIALEYGPIRAQAAQADGYDATDWTDPRNRFPDAAVGGGSKDSKKRAARVREWFRNWTGIDIDKQMLDYYVRWEEAGKPEDMKLFSPEDFNQLAMGFAMDINLSAHANRPSWARSASGRQTLLLFMQYPIWAMQKFETVFDRVSDRKWTEDFVKSLPYIFQYALIVAAMGLLSVGVKRLLDRLFNKESPFPTIADAETPKEAGVAILSAMADMIPFYGGAINNQLNRGYSTGFDLNNQFIALNLLTDGFKAARQVIETGGSLRPMQRFANRYIFPFNIIGQTLPNQAGLREIANTRNILASGTRATGLEGRLRKFQGGGDMTLTPGSPIVDDAVNAIGRNDMTAFREAFDRLVNYRKSLGDPKPEQSAIRAISARNPLRSIFGTKPTDFEMERIFKNLDTRRASEARSTLARFDTALASVRPRTTARRSTRSRRTRVGGLALRRRGGRRTTLRVRSPFRNRSRSSLRIRRPRRRRLSIAA